MEEERGTELGSHFVVKQRNKRTSTGQHKKKKYDRSTDVMPLVLREGDLDKIGDVVRDATMNLMSHFEAQY